MATASVKPSAQALHIRVLGGLEVSRGETRLPLPPSKKTRALLAYLVLTGISHRRERLCSLFWDVADDPRGALRWSLTRLRPLVDDPQAPRLVSDRELVEFRAQDVQVDFFSVKRAVAQGLEGLDLAALRPLADLFRGELLEGLELSDFHDFQAWCAGVREDARVLRTKILTSLVERLSAQPEQALPYARGLVAADPLNDGGRIRLIQLLWDCDRRVEAEQQLESGRRLLADLGQRPSARLEEAWAALRQRPATPGQLPPPVATSPAPEDSPSAPSPPLVGRDPELATLQRFLHRAESKLGVLLLVGEPGIGKSRLLEEAHRGLGAQGGVVLSAPCFEAERNRPYGPWIDALRAAGGNLDEQLLRAPSRTGGSIEENRELIFESLMARFRQLAAGQSLVLSFDDVQWLDGASAELLHYVCRQSQSLPVRVVLAARSGELPDNDSVMALLRALRRTRQLEELALGPLSLQHTQALLAALGANAHAPKAHEASAGNPLFLLEYLRAGAEPAQALPPSLAELVRSRLQRLAPEAADVLRWVAVCGRNARAQQLEGLSTLGFDGLARSLETLERHGLLVPALDARGGSGAFAFAHDLVRQVVYADLSEPRRRLMHQRVAALLEPQVKEDELRAGEVAHHAALAGDLELAARCCIAAGRRCLRVFANAEARAYARRGARYAHELEEAKRVRLLLELTQIEYEAGHLGHRAQSVETTTSLAERALELGLLEHARLGFHLASHLRWEKGDSRGAQRTALQAEWVSRAADEKDRLAGLAEAGRCLAMLEKDLPQAEAMLLEARALAGRLGVEPLAIPLASGILRAHQGDEGAAEALFQSARAMARREGNRLAEFQALERSVMLALDKGAYAEVKPLAEELWAIAQKLRDGSEAPAAKALVTLCDYAMERVPEDALRADLEALRVADSKQRLAYAAHTAAQLELARGRLASGWGWAKMAVEAAQGLAQLSLLALARSTLFQLAWARGERAQAQAQRVLLQSMDPQPLSARARAQVASALSQQGE